jgi:signal transduction histidine kinase
LAIELRLAEEASGIPPLLVAKLSAMRSRTEAALGSSREILHHVHPTVLATAGFVAAIRVQAQRAPVPVSVVGTGPRSHYDAEAAAYFACQEALQNVAKHAGRDARVTLRLATKLESWPSASRTTAAASRRVPARVRG